MNDVELVLVDSKEAELDELWSFVQNKKQQRWLWLAIDHTTGTLLAYTLGRRTDNSCQRLIDLLTPFNISYFYTDDWGSYDRTVDRNKHTVGKKNTQRIECKNLMFRTRVKRLCRKSICFSKTLQMHDIVIGLFINLVGFGYCL